MNFKYDLYISFSIFDNKPLADNAGWITSFQKFLTTLLEQILGEKVNLLSYNNQEKPSLTEISKVGVFVAVVSPEYVADEDCVEEIGEFFEQSHKNENLFINGRERIFKVIKFPVSVEDQPSKIANLLDYTLYDIDFNTGEPIEFSEYFNQEAQRKYWLRIVDLAYDIADVIKSLRQISITSVDYSTYNEKNIYLAETGFDLQLIRDNIKRELIRHGFRILPDHAHPTNIKELEVSIKKDLQKSRLSIHLIGDSYGDHAFSSEKSILDIQNKLASEHAFLNAGSNRFSRLIWISPDAKLQNDKQKIFVENLRREIEDTESAEIIQSPIEDFKLVVLEELLELNINRLTNEVLNSNQNPKKDQKIIYFIYDKIDEYEAKKIVDFLKYKNFEVLSPVFSGELLNLREIHISNLRNCDLAMIFVNKVNDLWLQMKVLDLLKAPGMGRTKGDFEKYIIMGKDFQNSNRNKLALDLPQISFQDNLEKMFSDILNTVKV